ncbi:MAG: SPOR domain-containing protein [Candidatus Omnitrophica bacterium]|nr:SPOR domain-containing protein [Candidatus Omnitrophota bacterium]
MNNRITCLIATVLLFCFQVPCFAAAPNVLEVKFLQGNFRDVALEGEAYLRNSPGSNQRDLYKLIAFSCLKINRPEEAKKYFQEFLRLSDKNAQIEEAKIGLADAFLINGEVDIAKKMYQSVLESNSGAKFKAAILYRLSKIARGSGNSDEADVYLAKLKREYPLNLELSANDSFFVSRDLKSRENSYFSGYKTGEVIYSVQVGYFSNTVNADKFKRQLISRGYPAYTLCVSEGCRVRVGKFNNLKEALLLQKKLSRDGFPSKVFP